MHAHRTSVKRRSKSFRPETNPIESAKKIIISRSPWIRADETPKWRKARVSSKRTILLLRSRRESAEGAKLPVLGLSLLDSTGAPPSPRSIGIIDFAGNCKVIYGLQSLGGKILSHKELLLYGRNRLAPRRGWIMAHRDCERQGQMSHRAVEIYYERSLLDQHRNGHLCVLCGFSRRPRR